MRESVNCQLIRSNEELLSLRASWSELWRNDSAATPFQSPAWLLPWWNHFGEGPLRTVAILRAGTLVGLLPFYLYTEPGSGERKLLPLGIATSDYLDGIFAPDCTSDEIITGLEHLTRDLDFDTLEVTQLRPGSPLGKALRRWSPESFQPGSGESTSQRQAVHLAEMPAKIRRNTRYYQARAAQAGTLEFSLVPPAQALEAYQALERFHQARWHSSGVLADPKVRACHREAVPLLAAEGIVQFSWLRLNGETIAVLYTLRDPAGRSTRSVYSYLTGFSAAHADLGPGSLVLACSIDQAASAGFSTFDFLRGEESYKSLWHTERLATDRFSWTRESGAELPRHPVLPTP